MNYFNIRIDLFKALPNQMQEKGLVMKTWTQRKLLHDILGMKEEIIFLQIANE